MKRLKCFIFKKNKKKKEIDNIEILKKIRANASTDYKIRMYDILQQKVDELTSSLSRQMRIKEELIEDYEKKIKALEQVINIKNHEFEMFKSHKEGIKKMIVRIEKTAEHFPDDLKDKNLIDNYIKLIDYYKNG